MKINNETTEKIIKCAMEVHKYFGLGYLEKVYQNAFAYELELSGFKVKTEQPINVNYKNILVGYYKVDILIENLIIVEIKCINKIITPHIMQVKNYLKSTGLQTGFIFNFNSKILDFKRIYP